MKKLFLILIALTIIMTPVQAHAKTVTRYATKTIKLKERCSDHAKTIAKVKVHTKLTIVKEYTNWARIKYNGKTVYTRKAYLHKTPCVNKYGKKYFKHRGVIRWGGAKWTWYTSRQFPRLKVPGRHVDKQGFICDKDGYICLASGRGNKKKHAIVPTPFGKYGKVYDTNGGYNNRWFDVYTNW